MRWQCRGLDFGHARFELQHINFPTRGATGEASECRLHCGCCSRAHSQVSKGRKLTVLFAVLRLESRLKCEQYDRHSSACIVVLTLPQVKHEPVCEDRVCNSPKSGLGVHERLSKVGLRASLTPGRLNTCQISGLNCEPFHRARTIHLPET
jgi:hypothetical protein